MSSMFRSPNDISSDPQEDSHGSDDGIEPSPEPLQPQESASESVDGDAIRLPPAPNLDIFGVTKIDPQAHSALMNTAMLEFFYRQRAAEILNQQAGNEGLYTRFCPEAIEFGKRLYEHSSTKLSSQGMVPPDLEHEDLGPIRQIYRDGLDMLSQPVLEDTFQLDPPARALSPFVKSAQENAKLLEHSQSLLRRWPPVGPDDQAMPSIDQTMAEMQIDQATREGATASKVAHRVGFTQSGTIMSPFFGSIPASYPLVSPPNPENSKLRSRYAMEFTEVKFLGKGGYGRVYHVINHVDGQDYAIKKIALTPKRFKKLKEGNAQEKVEAILKEIRTLARLEHSNVVRYYGAWMEMEGEAIAPSTPRRVVSPPRALIQDSPGRVDTEPGLDTMFEEPKYALTKSNEYDGVVFEESEHLPFETDGDNEDVFEESEIPQTETDGDDGIVFGETSNFAKPNFPPTPEDRMSRDRRPSHATTASTISKHSMVHSTGPEDDEDVEAIPREAEITSRGQTTTVGGADDDIFTEGFGERHTPFNAEGQTAAGLTVILHIQMSLHPLSLATYLSPVPNPLGLPEEVSSNTQSTSLRISRHCFHSTPSVRLMLAILDGVEYLHSQKIVHCDLKPGNIFLAESIIPSSNSVNVSNCSSCDTEDELPVYITPRIGDFGLVAEMSATDLLPGDTPHLSSLTSPGKPVGTEFYRPPMRTVSVDEKLDVFALGVVLFELMWKFDTRMERQMVLANLGKGVLPNTFAERAGDVGNALEKCILGMMRGDAEKRYGCAKVRRRLEKILAQEKSG